jgi:N6-adenosine-specific RNA methylase IME4
VDTTVIATGLGTAMAAPEPFVGLRRHYYGAIVIDPASHFSSYTAIQSQNWSSRRDNERHYRTMSSGQLAALPIRDLAAPTGCHLFCWTSGPFLPQALRLIEAWGFKFSTRCFTWLKTKRGWDGESPLVERDFTIGLGLTTRSQTELVLLARRGNCRRQRKDVRELILAPRREHSRKPDEFYRRVWSTYNLSDGRVVAADVALAVISDVRIVTADRGLFAGTPQSWRYREPRSS